MTGTITDNQNKVIYKGEFIENKLENQGTLTIENLGQYEGIFKNSFFHGEGNFVFSNIGDVYNGGWKNGQIHGEGKYTFANKELYDGSFQLGSKHGKGVMFFMNGDVYDGNWDMDQKFGEGVYKTSDGIKYEGMFADGFVNGTGKITY
jgi:hypothetical protein